MIGHLLTGSTTRPLAVQWENGMYTGTVQDMSCPVSAYVQLSLRQYIVLPVLYYNSSTTATTLVVQGQSNGPLDRDAGARRPDGQLHYTYYAWYA